MMDFRNYLFSFRIHLWACAAVLSVTAISSCSDSEPDQDFFDLAQLEEDYQKTPSGFLLRLDSNLCAHQNIHNLQEQNASASIRLTYQNADEINEDNVDRIFRGQAYMLDHSTDTSSVLPEGSSVDDLKMLNLPPTQFVALSQRTANYPAHFSLNLQANLNNLAMSLSPVQSPGQSPRQSKGSLSVGQSSPQQGTVKDGGKSTVHQGPVQKGSPDQQTKATLATSDPVQQTIVEPEPKGVTQGSGVSQSVVVKGTPEQLSPAQSPAKGKGAKGSTHTLASTQQQGSSASQNSGCQSIQQGYQGHFLNTFRPVYPSANLVGYNWGYYDRPTVLHSEEHTYLFYPRPVCSEAAWCSG